MKITLKQLKKLIKEHDAVAPDYYGDSYYSDDDDDDDSSRGETAPGSELIDESNFQHLEVGNLYLVYDPSAEGPINCTFVDWVDKQGNHTELEDPNLVDLRFAEEDGLEFEAYWDAIGSSADPLYVEQS